MSIPDIFQTLAVFLELVIAVFGFLIAVQKKRTCGWFIAATFALFVVFDIARILKPDLPAVVLSLIFFVACLSMTYAAWLLWKEK